MCVIVFKGVCPAPKYRSLGVCVNNLRYDASNYLVLQQQQQQQMMMMQQQQQLQQQQQIMPNTSGGGNPGGNALVDQWVTARLARDYVTADNLRAQMKTFGLDADSIWPKGEPPPQLPFRGV